jgi:hypothetical protein
VNGAKQVLAVSSVLMLIILATAAWAGGVKPRVAKKAVQSGTPWSDIIYTASDPLGVEHIRMDTRFGSSCDQCHDGTGQDAPRSLVGVPYVNMGAGQTCISCHDGRFVTKLFLSQMTNNTRYDSCANCHQVQ